MKKLTAILLMFFALNSFGQELRVIDWKTYVYNVVMLGVDTFQFDAEPFDYNDPGAATREMGNYFVDFAGRRFKIIDSTLTTLTVKDEYSTGIAPQSDQIGRVYQSVGSGDAEYIGGVDITSVDELSKWKIVAADNELFWRQMGNNIDSIGDVSVSGNVPTYKGGVFIDSFYVGVGGSVPVSSASEGQFFTDLIPVTGTSISVNYPDSMGNINYTTFIRAWTEETIDGKSGEFNNIIYNYTQRINGFDLTLGKAEGYLEYIAVDTLVTVLLSNSNDTLHLYSRTIPITSTAISVDYPENMNNINYTSIIEAWTEETIDGKAIQYGNIIYGFNKRINGFDLTLGKAEGFLKYFVTDTMSIYAAGGGGQTLSLSGDTLRLSNEGGDVILPDADSTNEIQILSISNDTINLSKNGLFVKLPVSSWNTLTDKPAKIPLDSTLIYNRLGEVENDTTDYKTAFTHVGLDHDTSATNEIQAITISNDTVNLNLGGGYVKLPTSVNYFTKSTGVLYPTTLTDKLGIGIVPTVKFHIKDSTGYEYAANFLNNHNDGYGVKISAGEGFSGQYPLTITQKNGTTITLRADSYGGLTTKNGFYIGDANTTITKSGSNMSFTDAVLGTKTLTELWTNRSGWISYTGYTVPDTITDEIRIGSATDLGSEKLQVNGGIALYDANPTIRLKDNDYGTGFTGQQYKLNVADATLYYDYMDAAGNWQHGFNMNGITNISSLPFVSYSYTDFYLIAAPGTPSTGYGRLWGDSSDSLLHYKDLLGTDYNLTKPIRLKSTATTGLFTVTGMGAGTTRVYTYPDSNATILYSGGALGTPSSGTLTNCTFPTLNQNTTGSAAKLTTARDLYGFSFDGSVGTSSGTNIIASGYGGTGNGFTKFSGAATSEKTYTLPNATCTILTSNAAVSIAQGGTGQTTAQAALDAILPTQTGNSGKYLTTNGANGSWGVAPTGEVDTFSTPAASRVALFFAPNKIGASSTIDSTELNYLNNVTSNIQTQLNGKYTISGTPADDQVLIALNSTTAETSSLLRFNGSSLAVGTDNTYFFTTGSALFSNGNKAIGIYPTTSDLYTFYIERNAADIFNVDSLGNVISEGAVLSDEKRVQNLSTNPNTMDVRSGYKAYCTVSSSVTINLSNVADGYEGTIIVTQSGGSGTVALTHTGGSLTPKKLGAKSNIDAISGKITKIVYERIGSNLFYGYVYEN